MERPKAKYSTLIMFKATLSQKQELESFAIERGLRLSDVARQAVDELLSRAHPRQPYRQAEPNADKGEAK